MRPVSTKVASIRCANAYPMVLLPEPDGPSMATASGPSPVLASRSPLTRRSGRLAHQPSNLGRGQRPPLPEAQAPDGERAQPDPDQPNDPQPNGSHEAPHLSLAPLAQAHPQPMAGLTWLAHHFPRRRGGAGGEQARRTVIQLDTVQQRHQLVRLWGRAPAAPRTRAPWRTGDAAADWPTPRRW